MIMSRLVGWGRTLEGVFLGFFVKDIDWDLRTVKG